MQGMLLRLAFYWGKPEFMMKRAASLWRQFNDEGEMELLSMDARARATLEVRGVATPVATFCRILTGWSTPRRRSPSACGSAVAHHVECRATGQDAVPLGGAGLRPARERGTRRRRDGLPATTRVERLAGS